MNDYQPRRNVAGLTPQDMISAQEAAARMFGDVQTNAKRVPQAEVVLKALIVEIEALHSDVATLLGRLAPVLRPAPPEKDDALSLAMTGAPLIDELQRQVALLTRLRGVVHSALDRLEV